GGVTVTLTGSFGDGAAEVLINTVTGLIITPDLYTPDRIEFTAPEGADTMELSLAVDGTSAPYMTTTVVAGEVIYTQRATTALAFYNPSVTSVYGCIDDGSVTRDCSTTGGEILTVTGENFGDGSGTVSVDVGGIPCDNVTLMSHQEIQCNCASASGGWDLPLTVTVGGRSGSLNGAVSFTGPVVDDFSSITDADPLGGETLTLTGMNFTDLAVVTYGPTGTEFQCLVAFQDFNLIQCFLSRGLGGPYQVHVRIADIEARPTTSTITYATPSIIDKTLRLSEEDTGDATLVLTELPARVWFDATGIPGGMLDYVDIFYTDGTQEQECVDAVLTEDASGQQIGCKVWTNLSTDDIPMGPSHLELRLPGVVVDGTDLLFFPASCPTLDSISGCMDSGATTEDCPTMGGVTLTITGSGFTPSTVVLVDGATAPSVFVSATVLTFTLPEGVGPAMVQVRQDGCEAPPLGFSYAAPAVTGVEGCPGSLEGPTYDCPKEGGTMIYIDGMNFGASGASVLVGGRPCTGVTHDFMNPHNRLSCLLPAGSGVDVPVTVINGFISSPSGTLSYQTP
ncbi:IPT/TIG domain-containing protein, partial [Myxococcota bacterium]|nr:IPT/TIG domain-containing protein [Myxococcota bacterium]MBU1534835.1 IPT/TIG domain-containing protein [Myxococcota bacterium]